MNNEYPVNVTQLSELVFPDYTRVIRLFGDEEEDVIKYDLGPGAGAKRIVIISTRRNIRYINGQEELYMDGTFKTCPYLFDQLYSIHGYVQHTLQPLMITLLSKKTENTYGDLLNNIKVLCPDFPRYELWLILRWR